MNAGARALLLMAAALGIVAAVFLLSRSGARPSSATEAASTGEGAPAAAQPTQAPARDEPHTLDAPDPPHRPVRSPAVEPPTPDSLAAAMHALEDSSPERALDLARKGLALWPSGAHAPEFAATEVKCLYRLGNPSEGRGAAEAMVNKYPTSPWALEVEKQTGAHPAVNH